MSTVDQFLERLQSISPTQKKRTSFTKRRSIDKVFCGFNGNHGKYQMLPFNSTLYDMPFVTLTGTREINMPRKNIAQDGQETVYNAWIRLLPKSAYDIKDSATGQLVSSLTAADEELLRQAWAIYDELYNELDARNNSMNPEVKNFIRKKNYTIWNAYCINYWPVGETRNPSRSNFSALFVVTAKGFVDLVNNAIQDTNLTSGMGKPNWTDDVYNRETSNRKGFLMFSISKTDQPGFSISVNHTLDAGAYLNGITIPQEDADLMSNPVEEFLGWQAARNDDSVPACERKLFNRALIQDTIQYMTDQLAQIRIAKQNKSNIGEAIAATNEMVLKNQVPTNTHGQVTNDPVLASMQKPVANNNGFNVPNNPEAVAMKNNNPMQTPPAAHIDPLSGAPVRESGNTPFTKPSFAGGFGGGENDLPF